MKQVSLLYPQVRSIRSSYADAAAPSAVNSPSSLSTQPFNKGHTAAAQKVNVNVHGNPSSLHEIPTPRTLPQGHKHQFDAAPL